MLGLKIPLLRQFKRAQEVVVDVVDVDVVVVNVVVVDTVVLIVVDEHSPHRFGQNDWIIPTVQLVEVIPAHDGESDIQFKVWHWFPEYAYKPLNI